MKSVLWFTLLKIAELGTDTVVSTSRLGKQLGLSQQSTSRHIQELEKNGLIERVITSKGQKILLTNKGLKKLKEVYWSLKIIFGESVPVFTLKGVVFTGLGEGAYYVSRPNYQRQFEKKLGFIPFPGTLNLRLTEEADIKTRKLIESMPGIIVQSFKNSERTFGDVKCFNVIINNKVPGALIFVQRTHYPDNVVEVISKNNLRKELELKDGDIVQLDVKPGH